MKPIKNPSSKLSRHSATTLNTEAVQLHGYRYKSSTAMAFTKYSAIDFHGEKPQINAIKALTGIHYKLDFSFFNLLFIFLFL